MGARGPPRMASRAQDCRHALHQGPQIRAGLAPSLQRALQQAGATAWARSRACLPGAPCCCSGVVLRVLFHPKQPLLFSCGDDSEVRVWDLVDKAVTGVLKVGGGRHGRLRLGAVCW